MKVIKGVLMDNIISPGMVEELGNAARLLTSWLDGILEFTILKHEVIVLRLKNNKVMDKIRVISRDWPRKKDFIEGAYKVLLFTKNSRRQVSFALSQLRELTTRSPSVLGYEFNYDFMDYESALGRVIKNWYEQRIHEETSKNLKLRELHDKLTQMKLLKQQQELGGSQETQELVGGQIIETTRPMSAA